MKKTEKRTDFQISKPLHHYNKYITLGWVVVIGKRYEVLQIGWVG